ncbi:MAG TPA: hypothetical protein VF746_18400 [Longimicrobium sp.]|jgi:hypothetical protein
MRFRSAVAALLLAGCTVGSTSDPDRPTVLVGRESDDPGAHMARLKAVVRQDARTSYGAECGTISVPDDAFIPIEITGGGLAEVAVTFGRVRCGLGPTRFSGTGGVLVQFWIGSGGPVRLLLEQQMHGFTPVDEGLVTMQHGGYCPDGAGPDQCRVTYRWNDRDRRLEVVERRLASSPGRVEAMAYDWETLSR